MCGFRNDSVQFFSLMSRRAVLMFHTGLSTVKVTRARQLVPRQPSSSPRKKGLGKDIYNRRNGPLTEFI